VPDTVWGGEAQVWRDLVEAVADGIALFDERGILRHVNAALSDLLKRSREELLRSDPPFVDSAEGRRSGLGEMAERVRRGQTGSFDIVLEDKTGRPINASVQLALAQPIGHVATIRDVTEFLQREQSLRAQGELWRSLTENPFEYIMTIDRAYRFTFLNRYAPGQTPETVLGKATPFDFVEPQYADVMRRTLIDAIEHGKGGSYDVYVPALDAWFTTIVGPIYKDRAVIGASMLARDVTAQRKLELAVGQSQRMEALGRLAGGVAHDFNNLLVPIVANTQLVRDQLAPGDPSRVLLDDAIKAAARAKDLVSRILVFARGASTERQPVQIQVIAEEVVRLLRAGARANVEIVADLAADCPPIAGVPSEVHQIVTNLCANAIQALAAEGGRIDVTVRRMTSEEGKPLVALVVQDTGPGIDHTLVSKIFEPFFTTRPTGEGTGLGLSIVQAIATRYAGTVSVVSQPGQGARFEVLLPAMPEASAAAPAPAPRQSPRTERALRILCVDDDELVSRAIKRGLERAGHQVLCLHEPRAALDHLRAQAASVDIVISDDSMPHMTGVQLAHQLGSIAPALPVLLMTGNTANVASPLPANIKQVLAKPFDTAQLNAAILAIASPA
jgi:two-component system cell cycle sensor histidine kinase/response regulator CckA